MKETNKNNKWKRLLRRAIPAAVLLALGLSWSLTGAGRTADVPLTEDTETIAAVPETAVADAGGAADAANAETAAADSGETGAGFAKSDADRRTPPVTETEAAETAASSGTEETDTAPAAGLTADSRQSAAAEPRESRLLFVYICGAVAAPDTYELPEGARIADAVQAAGGFREDASRETLNLAERLVDGEMIRVPTEAEVNAGNASADTGMSGGRTDTCSSGTVRTADTVAGQNAYIICPGDHAETAQDIDSTLSPGSAAGVPASVNINTADSAALCTLPGIGEKKAEKIIAYREANGKFASPEDIMNVPGIKEKAFEKMRDRICTE